MKKTHFILLAAIIALGIFLRTYRLSELFYFTHDEETIVWRVMPLLRDSNLFLLGGVTPFHVHLGPWFYYLSAIILWFSKLNPLGWGVATVVVSAGTMMLLFLLTRKLSGLFPALIASTLYSFSFLMIAFDRHWWPLSLGPLLSLVVIYCLVKIIEGKLWFTLVLASALSLGFHTDPSNWVLILLVATLLLIFKISPKQKPVLLSIAVFAFSFLSLVAFDLKNHGKNILEVQKYLTETKPHQGWSVDRFVWTALYIPRTLGRLLYSPQTELTEIYSYCPEYSLGRIESAPLLTTLLATLIIALYLFYPKSSSEVAAWTPRTVDALIRLYFGLIFVGINIYGNFFSSDLFDHYLVTLFPLFFIMFAIVLTRFLRPPVIILLLSCVLLLNLNSFRHISNRYGYADKIAVVNWAIQELNGQPFSFDVLGSCFRYSGIRYLFTLQGREPDLSYVDPNFFWLYRTPPKTQYPNNHVVFVMQNVNKSAEFQQQYIDLLGHITARRQFGNIDTLIINNSNKKFTIDFSQ